MKRTTSLVTLVAAVLTISLAIAPAASPSSAAPRASTTSAPFNATITAPLLGIFLGCCHHSFAFEPTAVTVPRIGRAVLSGGVSFCGNRGPCIPEERGTTLSLTFVTPSGDTLTLGGFTHISASHFAWSVVGGTGRFANASGSGLYEYDWKFTEDDLIATIVLSGTFRLRG